MAPPESESALSTNTLEPEAQISPEEDSLSKGPRFTRLLILLPAAISVIALLATWVGIKNFLPPSENSVPLLRESWDILSIQGSRVGGSHQRQWKSTIEGQSRIITESTETLKLLRQGQEIHLEVITRCEETLQGVLIQGKTQQKSKRGPPIEQTIFVDGTQLQIRQQMPSSHSTRSLDWSPQVHGYFGIESSLRKKMLIPREHRELQYIVPLINQIAQVALRAIDFETVELISGSTQLLRIEVSTTLDGKTTASTLWCDGSGEVIRSLEPALQLTSERVTRELALWQSPKPKFDIIENSRVTIHPPIQEPFEQTQLHYQVQLREGAPTEIFAQDDRQKMESLDATRALLSVHSQWLNRESNSNPPTVSQPPKTPPQAIHDTPSASTLAPSQYIQSDDPEIVAWTNRRLNDLGLVEPGPMAVELEKAVHHWIRKKGYQQIFATASEVFQSRRGDCTEHAVLLAAACRAQQIPARMAVGLIYVPEQQSFLFHLWTEAWWEHAWHGLDATLGRGGVGAVHLKLHSFTLENDNLLAEMTPVNQVIGQLQIKIVPTSTHQTEPKN